MARRQPTAQPGRAVVARARCGYCSTCGSALGTGWVCQVIWGRAEQHPYESLAAGRVEGRSTKICILSALGNLLNMFFGEAKGLMVGSILLLRAVPWGNEEDRIARTEGYSKFLFWLPLN